MNRMGHNNQTSTQPNLVDLTQTNDEVPNISTNTNQLEKSDFSFNHDSTFNISGNQSYTNPSDRTDANIMLNNKSKHTL